MTRMTYVITDPCVSTCDTACATVCPVDAIHGPTTQDELDALDPSRRRLFVLGPQLMIDPARCICCSACAPECPVDAIFDDVDVPARFATSIERNAAFFR